MSHARPARRVRAFRPRLEVLEDRHLLSTYVVDRLTATGAGSGLAGDLRYCITQAADGDAITFGAGVTGTINVGTPLPTLTHSITIDGPGPGLLTIDKFNRDPVFSVSQGATVRISGLTVSHDYQEGGGIENLGTLDVSNCTISDNGAVDGGGIRNLGTLTVSSSTISGNLSTTQGGGIWNGGTLTVSNSTISGNIAYGGGEYSEAGGGGGITNRGTMIITNSTITDNYTGSYCGGIYNLGTSATLTISNSTISGSNGDGLFTGYGGIVNMRNTILAGNEIDLDGALSSSGHNLIGSTWGGSGFDDTDLLNVDPLLGPLQDNGGSTQTMALLAGSPALNSGDPTQLGVADQRGVVRSGGVNIGAYQASASALAMTGPATATAGTPFDVTVKAVDSFGQTAVGYTGTATFTSADPYGATLPADYHFTLADGGVHTFGAGATLYTAGNWDVTATDAVTASITGAATVTVSPAAADHLLFLQQPADTAAGQTLSPVIVEVVDAFGNVETGDNSDTITLSIGANPGGGTLSGTLTVTVVNGVATFSDLSIDLAGSGYTLHASIGGGLPDMDSNPFTITM
jgi:hypothetical protein